MITPRATRLLRVSDLTAFRSAVAALASEGSPFDARDRLVVVPTRAAAALLRTTLEHRHLETSAAIVLPEFALSREIPSLFASRAVPSLVEASPEAREILMGVAGIAAAAQGYPPPFRLRPRLIAEVLALYDSLRQHRKDVPTFERLALGRLEPGADHDRGAERLVRQTRFLASAFRTFEQLAQEHGLVDQHRLRDAAIATAAKQPWRHVVITVGDASRDEYGLHAADWDLLTRVPGLERLDLVVTDRVLAGSWHERVHDLLPGIEEMRVASDAPRLPRLRVPGRTAGVADGGTGRAVMAKVWEARDREEEIADFARWARALHRADPDLSLDRIALVVRQPLPYVYLAREVLRSANVPCQTFETVPLAAEPYAATLDLVFSSVSTNCSRAAVIALLSTPHLRWEWENDQVSPDSIAAANRLLSERGHLGGADSLRRAFDSVASVPAPRGVSALPALGALVAAADELLPLFSERPASDQLDTLLAFLRRHDAGVAADDFTRSRQIRARAAITGILSTLREHYGRLDTKPVDCDHLFSVVRRWIEAHTFAPRSGDGGLHLVDAESARFGEFDHVQLAGLVDGEWPPRTQGNIFYSASLLRDLGWAAESERTEHAREAFADLLALPSTMLTVSTFGFEEDTLVAPSSLVEELDAVSLEVVETDPDPTHIFELEVLCRRHVVAAGMDEGTQSAVEARLQRAPASDPRFHGQTVGHAVAAYSLSALERYQDCPFKFFANDVLRLQDIPDDEPFLSPRARGRFIHEVFQRFFEAWDGHAARTLTVDNLVEARALFVDVAERMLTSLGESDAALERARLFGSAISVGIVDVVLGLEASRPDTVTERWLESSFDGEFTLGHPEGPGVPLRGIADRVDLLEGHRLRVIDYKTGYAPSPGRALQVPIYALCASELAARRDGQAWTVADAAYFAFTGKRSLVSVVESGEDPRPTLDDARGRLLEVIGGVSRGTFPPRPDDIMLCRSCSYPSVCRKDYVDG
ncbi:MAG: PD-(D/E)XK nuclease family protein [Vicinamibacterales bacterium]